MPIYSIRNNDTGAQWEENITWDELQELLKELPHLEQIFTYGPNVVSDMRGPSGIKHTPEFRDVLQKVKHHHPLSTIDAGNKTTI